MPVTVAKKTLRAQMKVARAAIDLYDHRRMSMDIMHRVMDLDEWTRSKTTHIYVSCINNEVDTLGLIYALLDRGVRVVVPRCGGSPCELTHQWIESMDELLPARRCLVEPACLPEREVAPGAMELVLAPVVAFDRAGGRLGMGGGYYDAFLKHCTCPKVGLAFGFQEAPRVPMESHDTRLDIIITERETIRVLHE